MGIDILNLPTTTVSRDLANKFILIYGESKVGKTSFAAKIPDSLLLAFEIGYHAIPGLKAVDIDKWATFKLVLKQLEKPDAKKMYKSVIIDTATIAYDYCEQYICMQNGVDRIGDIPYGGRVAAALGSNS